MHRGSYHITEPRGANREETTNRVRVDPGVPMGDDNPVGQHLVRYVGPVSQYFPPLGILSWLTGIGSLVLNWRVKSARYWILASLIMIVCQGLISMVFFWPRNTIMFAEGTAVHSAALLQQTAQEFQTGHWVRVAFNAAASALAFVGFLKFYRCRTTSQYCRHETM